MVPQPLFSIEQLLSRAVRNRDSSRIQPDLPGLGVDEAFFPLSDSIDGRLQARRAGVDRQHAKSLRIHGNSLLAFRTSDRRQRRTMRQMVVARHSTTSAGAELYQQASLSRTPKRRCAAGRERPLCTILGHWGGLRESLHSRRVTSAGPARPKRWPAGPRPAQPPKASQVRAADFHQPECFSILAVGRCIWFGQARSLLSGDDATRVEQFPRRAWRPTRMVGRNPTATPPPSPPNLPKENAGCVGTR